MMQSIPKPSLPWQQEDQALDMSYSFGSVSGSCLFFGYPEAMDTVLDLSFKRM